MKDVCELPVMKTHCKTCPFRPDKDGNFKSPELVNEIIGFTYMKGQHTCHSTDYGLIDLPKHRCRGSFNYFKKLYDSEGIGHLIQEEPITIGELYKKIFG